MRRSMVLLAALAIAACDLPTEAPAWEQEWQVPVPVDSLQLGVAELLPASVRARDDGSEFLTTVPGVTARFALATMCGACAGLSGPTPVKPAFGDTLLTSSSLPPELLSAVISPGQVSLRLSHTFGFDPLRPSSDPDAERGYLVIAVSSNGNLLAEDSIDGADRAFPRGTVLEPVLTVQAAEAAGAVVIELRIHSPRGDATTVSARDELVLTLDPTEVGMSEATVTVADPRLGPESRTIGMAVDAGVLDRIQRGALLAEVSNGLGVTGQVTVWFRLPSGDIQRSVALTTGTYRERLEFTAAELREILGQDEVDVAVEGEVAAPGGVLTVRPGRVIEFDLQLEVFLLIGSTDEGI